MVRPLQHPILDHISLDGILHAMSDPIRREIFFNLEGCEAKPCNKSVEGLAPSTLSFHYKILREAGLVHSEKKGIEVLNTIRTKDLNKKFPGLINLIKKFHNQINPIT